MLCIADNIAKWCGKISINVFAYKGCVYTFFSCKDLSPFGQTRTVGFVNISYYFIKVNVWENRRDNEDLTIHRNWQHWAHKTQDEYNKTKNTTQYAIISRFYSLDESTSLSVLLITAALNVEGMVMIPQTNYATIVLLFSTINI